MTNGDKIRQMTDEEMAKFLDYCFNHNYWNEICKWDCSFKFNSERCVLEWLHKESDNNDAV